MKIKYFLQILLFLALLSVSVLAQKLNFDASFTPTVNASVNFVEIVEGGKILIAGDFTTVNGVARTKIARLNADGTLDPTFDANWLPRSFGPGSVNITAMKILPDGKILLGGLIPDSISSGNLRVYRLLADGAIDASLTSIPTFAQESAFQTINKIAQLPNGKLLVCGKFTTPKPYLARFNANGTYDATFTPAIDNE